jgi:hypothetical protein
LSEARAPPCSGATLTDTWQAGRGAVSADDAPVDGGEMGGVGGRVGGGGGRATGEGGAADGG